MTNTSKPNRTDPTITDIIVRTQAHFDDDGEAWKRRGVGYRGPCFRGTATITVGHDRNRDIKVTVLDGDTPRYSMTYTRTAPAGLIAAAIDAAKDLG